MVGRWSHRAGKVRLFLLPRRTKASRTRPVPTWASGDVARVELDVRIDLGNGGASDLFRFGITTLDSSGSFVPALKNNGGSALTGRIAYNGTSTNVLTIWPDETTVASQVELTASQLGLNFGAGDRLTDELRITWEAEKSATPGVWDVGMVITNLDTGTELGRNTIPVTEPTAYNTSDGLYAGIRGLANNSMSTFRVDRFAFGQSTPSASLPGDYNGDGTVDSADYTVFRDQEGQTGSGLTADSDGSGVVDEVDRVTWLSNYGQSLPLAPATLVAAATYEEPQTLVTDTNSGSPPPLRGPFVGPDPDCSPWLPSVGHRLDNEHHPHGRDRRSGAAGVPARCRTGHRPGGRGRPRQPGPRGAIRPLRFLSGLDRRDARLGPVAEREESSDTDDSWCVLLRRYRRPTWARRQ